MKIGDKVVRFEAAPGLSLPKGGVNQVRHHAVLGHGMAVQAIRAKGKKGTQVGPAEVIQVAVPLLGLLIKLSLFLTVLSYGMLASWDDVMYLFRRPGQLIRALLSINVIMPILMLLMALFFDLDPVVQVALIALAVSPVPPGLPGQLLKAGGSRAFTFGLLAAVSLLSVITVPLVLNVFDRLTPGEVRLSVASIFQTVVTSAVVPIVIGMLIRYFAPAFAERVAGPLGKIAMIVLLVSFLPILIFGLLPLIWSVASLGTILAIIAFTVIGITVGHFLGGPDLNDRAALALATSARHPAIAIALAIANVSQTETKKAVAVILLYLLVSGSVSNLPVKLPVIFFL